MIKFKQGWIRNMNGIEKDVVVKSKMPNTCKDLMIGGSLTLAGILYLTYTAFKRGSQAHETAEYETMVDLGIIKDD